MDDVSVCVLPSTEDKPSKNVPRSNKLIRNAFSEVGAKVKSVPTRTFVICQGAKEVTLGFEDARTLLRNNCHILLPQGPGQRHSEHALKLNSFYGAFFVEIRLDSPDAQLSFQDSATLTDLMPNSSRVVHATENKNLPRTWNLYFADAVWARRFVDNPPPFIADFLDLISIEVNYHLSWLSRDNFRAAIRLKAFPVIYQLVWRGEIPSDREVESRIWMGFGSSLSHVRHPYPEWTKSRGILFFRSFKDAQRFVSDGCDFNEYKIFHLSCAFNDAYARSYKPR